MSIKKVYRKPVLKKVGTLEEMTLGPSSGNEDGKSGSYGNQGSNPSHPW
jgi:hypothetical protein